MNWNLYDNEYFPKRKISNSRNRYCNVTGAFRSAIMNKMVEYESLSECIFYYCLEQHIENVLRYYPQPVSIPVPYINTNSEVDYWYHTPDCLIFFKDKQPILCEIKYSNEDLDKPDNLTRFRYAKQYALERKWQYGLFVRQNIDKVILYNLQFLAGYRFAQPHYKYYIDSIISALQVNNSLSVYQLASLVAIDIDYKAIIPIVYYLMFIKKLQYDKTQIIDNTTIVQLNKKYDIGGIPFAQPDTYWNHIRL